MDFQCYSFDQLSLELLYAIMALRQEVFIVEQDCPYLDADGRDQAAHHLLGRSPEGRLMAYARLLPPGLVYAQYAAISRVVVSPDGRAKGLGRELMQQAIIWADRLYDRPDLKLSAQSHLTDFYKSLGFFTTGEPYLEDGIPHVAMIRISL